MFELHLKLQGRIRSLVFCVSWPENFEFPSLTFWKMDISDVWHLPFWDAKKTFFFPSRWSSRHPAWSNASFAQFQSVKSLVCGHNVVKPIIDPINQPWLGVLWMVSKSCSTRWLKSWNPMNHGINRQLVQDFATIHCGKHHPRSRRGSNFSNLKLTGAKRREWMCCWGLLGSFLIVIMMIMDHSLIPYVHKKNEGVPLNSEESHSHWIHDIPWPSHSWSSWMMEKSPRKKW